jgi:pimeloyl-ACP methyl ester carboxylesterase
MAVLYAIEFPERVKKLILVSPADMLVMKPGKSGLFGEVEKKLPEGKKNEYKTFIKEYLDFGKIFDKNEAYFKKMNEKFGEYYFEALKRNGGAGNAEGYGEVGGWISNGFYMSLGMYYDYTKLVKNIKVPTLILGGANDFSGQHTAEEEYKRLIGGSEYRIIPNASHFALLENPVESAKAMGEFLGK